MKYYEGINRGIGGQIIMVCETDGRSKFESYPLKHHVRHSPDGFQWGYKGSGPAETARCILIDYFGEDEKKAETLYLRFEDEIISKASKRLFITERDIRDWIKGERSYRRSGRSYLSLFQKKEEKCR